MTVLLSPMCLPLNAWPQLDQVLWTNVTHPGSILDDETPRAASWRSPTKKKVRKGYGRWLHFLLAFDQLDTRVHPADRITLDHVRPYVETLQAQVATETNWSYVTSLHQVAKIFAPDRD